MHSGAFQKFICFDQFQEIYPKKIIRIVGNHKHQKYLLRHPLEL